MKNGNSNGPYRLCPLSNWALLLYCLIAGLSLCGCRSTRNTVEETHREIQTDIKETISADTLQTATTASESLKDSAELRATEHAIIKIMRDTSGRIIEIVATRTAEVGANSIRNAECNQWLYSTNASYRTEASDAENTITQKKKETQKEFKAGAYLERTITICLAALIIFFYIGDYLYKLWKKKQQK